MLLLMVFASAHAQQTGTDAQKDEKTAIIGQEDPAGPDGTADWPESSPPPHLAGKAIEQPAGTRQNKAAQNISLDEPCESRPPGVPSEEDSLQPSADDGVSKEPAKQTGPSEAHPPDKSPPIK